VIEDRNLKLWCVAFDFWDFILDRV